MIWKTTFVLLFFIIISAKALPGCGGDDDDDDNGPVITPDDDAADDDDTGADDDADDDIDDDDDASPPDDLPLFLQERSHLTDWSSWGQLFDHANPTPQPDIGGFGFGNGRVFSMTACREPFLTLHNLTGPDYQKHFRFFSDKYFELRAGGNPVAWQWERAWRIRKTGIVVTRMDSGPISLWAVDFAPEGNAATGTPAADSLVRIIILQNRTVIPLANYKLHVQTPYGRVDRSVINEIVGDDDRRLAAGFTSDEGLDDGKPYEIALDMGEIPAGGEVVTGFVTSFALQEDPYPVFEYTAGQDLAALLESTYEKWIAFTNEGAQVSTSDESYDDLIEGMSVSFRTQQAERGGISPMSEYSFTWLRDIIGATRFYTAVGRFDDYKRMLDYSWNVSVANAALHNAAEVDMDFDPDQEQPDWENMGALSGKTGAESPSYLILHYKGWLDATGDWSLIDERYGMLRYALLKQDFRNGCLLPFSDDETFRPAMALSFGHSLELEYVNKYLSANSSFLFVVAAEFMARVARHFGYEDHAAEYETIGAAVRECTEQYYWMSEKGYYSPIIDINTLAPDPRPFEDVNTQPLWCGYLSPDDAQAKENILNVRDKIGHDDGLIYTPIAWIYRGLARMLLHIDKGAGTGMVYGYYLQNLAAIDHPAAEDAFQAFRWFFHETGNVSEGVVLDDGSRASYLYDPYGFVCDLTARYRTWEGGIDAEAMLYYVFGLTLDAENNRIALAPHLPADWDHAEIRGVRLGDGTFDVGVEDDGAIRKITVENATGPLVVDAKVSVEGDIYALSVNGASVEYSVEYEWGRARARLEGLEADAGSPLVIEATHALP